MSLTDVIIRKAKSKDKQYKLADSGGMFLLVTPSGSKYWRLKYRIANKEKLLAIGVYPEISLKEAREKRDEAKKLIRDGIDPSLAKKEQKRVQEAEVENTFENVAREWHEDQKRGWTERYKNAPSWGIFYG